MEEIRFTIIFRKVYNNDPQNLQFLLKNMELAKTKRARLIRQFLMNAIKAGDSNFLHNAIEIFSVSRQAIHKHLAALVKMGYLSATGKTSGRAYILGPVRSHVAGFPLEGLQEDDVYSRDFSFIFNDLPDNIARICNFGFTEILNNAIDHSGGTTASIIVERDLNSIQIHIYDDGEGIFNHIARILKLSDPRQSLLELSKGKLTTDPQNHTGQGIFFTSRAFDSFVILSGKLYFSHDDKDQQDFLGDAMGTDRKGSAVVMEISMSSNRTLKSVFDDFSGTEDEDYAFNKTVVPVKLARYEGGQLTSRSQAKRILNGLDKFKIVWLDFSGIDHIGQAFADEVFRVFIRTNPQIEITAINLTESVRKTIRAARTAAKSEAPVQP